MAEADDIERVTAPARRGGWAWPALALFAVSLILLGVRLTAAQALGVGVCAREAWLHLVQKHEIQR